MPGVEKLIRRLAGGVVSAGQHGDAMVEAAAAELGDDLPRELGQKRQVVGGSWWVGIPAMRASPSVGSMKLRKRLIVVVFPAPFAPSMA